jgi:uncharacterized protein YcgL (UPF0745 family)
MTLAVIIDACRPEGPEFVRHRRRRRGAGPRRHNVSANQKLLICVAYVSPKRLDIASYIRLRDLLECIEPGAARVCDASALDNEKREALRRSLRSSAWLREIPRKHWTRLTIGAKAGSRGSCSIYRSSRRALQVLYEQPVILAKHPTVLHRERRASVVGRSSHWRCCVHQFVPSLTGNVTSFIILPVDGNKENVEVSNEVLDELKSNG